MPSAGRKRGKAFPEKMDVPFSGSLFPGFFRATDGKRDIQTEKGTSIFSGTEKGDGKRDIHLSRKDGCPFFRAGRQDGSGKGFSF
jgi:hypothetical protein